jgi:hypothetical protein
MELSNRPDWLSGAFDIRPGSTLRCSAPESHTSTMAPAHLFP